AAFTNSKLRIAVNQFHWQHSHDSIMPKIESAPTPGAAPAPVVQRPSGRGGRLGGGEGAEGAPGRTGAGQATAPAGGRRGGAGRLGGEGGEAPGTRVGGAGGAGPVANQPPFPFQNRPSGGSAAPEQEEDMNLMNLSLYGIAAVYEKYPPKPEGAGATAA